MARFERSPTIPYARNTFELLMENNFNEGMKNEYFRYEEYIIYAIIMNVERRKLKAIASIRIEMINAKKKSNKKLIIAFKD